MKLLLLPAFFLFVFLSSCFSQTYLSFNNETCLGSKEKTYQFVSVELPDMYEFVEIQYLLIYHKPNDDMVYFESNSYCSEFHIEVNYQGTYKMEYFIFYKNKKNPNEPIHQRSYKTKFYIRKNCKQK